ncbi:MAG: pyruvate dehydrogenase (acetyl-transferring) E1 component subunit alpha [Chloroflexi bacterium]|nr:pyruvate dehydrogenase (acetyl-transferring) E1 component subunit alpha [Chloroflexota bacterium]MCL5274718.1 pyruvate dehydrogenase (acetyl-transferring) E1 component subunit alpha [Chloroflexota bacterium]
MNKEELVSLYRQMLLIRVFEDKSAEMYAKAKIAGFLHLYNGQEAVAVGALSALRPDDDLVTHYRDHGYALARGLDARKVMAELYGRAGGTTGGRGGSMHIADVSKHFWGGYAIVGGHLPLATGLAYANVHHKTDRIVLAVMGDGSTNIGTFHATLNWAQLWRLPVIFLVENNQYAMGTAISVHSAVTEIYKKAHAYEMLSERADGKDVLAVHDAVAGLAERARSGGGPALLEVVTYRYRAHSMADSDVQRPKAEISEQKERDPIDMFLANVLVARNLITSDEVERIKKRVDEEVEAAVQFADASPEPALDTLYNDIYAQPVANMQIGGSLISPATLYTGNGKHG